MTRGPLSYGQHLLRILDAAEPGSVLGPGFTNAVAYRIAGPVEPRVLQAALDDIVARHEALRTVIVTGAGVPHQRIAPPAPARLAVTDVAGSDDAAAREFVAAVAAAAPPPVEPPLLRAHLGRLAGGGAVLVLDAHHSAADEWSFELIIRDLAAAYRARLAGAEPALPPPTRYADVAAAMRSREGEARIRAALEHWKSTLDGAVPWDARPAGPPSGRRVRFCWAGATGLAGGVRAASRTRRTTPFVTVLAAFAAAVGRDEITVPVLTAGRGQSAWSAVGFFVNVVPVRIDLRGDPSPDELVGRVHEAFGAAFAHEVPFSRLLEAVPAAGTLMAAHPPVFQLIQQMPARPARPGDPFAYRMLDMPAEVRMAGAAPFGLLWTVRLGLQMSGWVVHDDGLFPPSRVARLAERLDDSAARLLMIEASPTS